MAATPNKMPRVEETATHRGHWGGAPWLAAPRLGSLRWRSTRCILATRPRLGSAWRPLLPFGIPSNPLPAASVAPIVPQRELRFGRAPAGVRFGVDSIIYATYDIFNRLHKLEDP